MSFLKALHAVNHESDAWRNSPKVGAPPRDWWVAIESLLSVGCAERPEQQFQKPLADLVDAYLNAMTKAANDEISFTPELANELAVKALEIALAPIGRALAALNIAEKNGPAMEPITEGIKELAEHKGPYGEPVGNEQISRMYGIKMHEVQAFLEGRFKLPKGHVPPGVADWRKERQKEEGAYAAAAYRWNLNRGVSPLEEGHDEVDDWREPAESVRELLDQGVTVEQICRMWRMSPQEVIAVRDGNSVEDLQPAGMTDDELERLTAPKGGK